MFVSLLCKITTERLKLRYFSALDELVRLRAKYDFSQRGSKRGRKPRSPQMRGIFAFFGYVKSTLWNWVTLQRYSPE